MERDYAQNTAGPSLETDYWVAVQVRPNYERVTAAHFELRRQPYFLPLYHVSRRWSDRTKQMECPLFPGYLFCRYNEARRKAILVTTGVLRILGYGAEPIPVRSDEIAAIKRIVESGRQCEPCACLKTGERVSITGGCLRGLEGLVVGAKGRTRRFVVSLTLLQRSVAVEVDVDMLAPIGAPGLGGRIASYVLDETRYACAGAQSQC